MPYSIMTQTDQVLGSHPADLHIVSGHSRAAEVAHGAVNQHDLGAIFYHLAISTGVGRREHRADDQAIGPMKQGFNLADLASGILVSAADQKLKPGRPRDRPDGPRNLGEVQVHKVRDYDA